MTQFQMLALVLFSVVVAAAYRNELLAAVKKFTTKQSGLAVQSSIAATIVSDLLSVTELRDKLAAEDCPDGVEACTNLLRVIVEQTKPTKSGV
jgi:hypothetical protein